MRNLLIAVALSMAWIAIIGMAVKIASGEAPIYHEWYKTHEYTDPGDPAVMCWWRCDANFHDGGFHVMNTGGFPTCPYPWKALQ